MYGGTLASKGPWEALVTFQQFIVLANQHGEVDMTPEAISGRTTIPLEIIKRGIQALEQPDPDSRTPAAEGRRIVRLDDHRSWGWSLVNYEKYCHIQSDEERREYFRNYRRAEREAKRLEQFNSVQDCSSVFKNVQGVTDIDVDVKKEGAPALPSLSIFTGQHLSVTKKQDALLGEAFPWVDRPAEYRKADSWLEANSDKRPKKHGKFLHNWFSRIVPPKGQAKPVTTVPRRSNEITDEVRAEYAKFGVRV
ncbi:MAG: hypothetical protein WBR26_27785 [Candidatus Acidiferrum sp.]